MSRILPPEVEQLVRRHLPSMDHAEVLLKVGAAPDERWTIARASAELGGRAVGQAVMDLHGAQLLVALPEDEAFRLSPDASVRHAVQLLADAYNQLPVTLIKAIYNRPADPLHSFADAFRLRKDAP